MPPHLPGCSRIYVKKVQRLVELHLQYVGVSGNEELRWRGIQLPYDAAVVVAGITTDVLHQHVYVLALPSEHLGEHSPKVASVAIATYCSQRCHLA